jgi:hypothetical protein
MNSPAILYANRLQVNEIRRIPHLVHEMSLGYHPNHGCRPGLVRAKVGSCGAGRRFHRPIRTFTGPPSDRTAKETAGTSRRPHRPATAAASRSRECRSRSQCEDREEEGESRSQTCEEGLDGERERRRRLGLEAACRRDRRASGERPTPRTPCVQRSPCRYRSRSEGMPDAAASVRGSAGTRWTERQPSCANGCVASVPWISKFGISEQPFFLLSTDQQQRMPPHRGAPRQFILRSVALQDRARESRVRHSSTRPA